MLKSVSHRGIQRREASWPKKMVCAVQVRFAGGSVNAIQGLMGGSRPKSHSKAPINTSIAGMKTPK